MQPMQVTVSCFRTISLVQNQAKTHAGVPIYLGSFDMTAESDEVTGLPGANYVNNAHGTVSN